VEREPSIFDDFHKDVAFGNNRKTVSWHLRMVDAYPQRKLCGNDVDQYKSSTTILAESE
jgi:hypothetical protein